MYSYTDFAGVIFDVDGTLLDDRPPGETTGLHEQSRLLAAHAVGKRRGIDSLQRFTPQQCYQAFVDSRAHMVQAVVWEMLVIAGQVSDKEEVQYDHPLVQEIVRVKEELHEEILRTKGREVPGASGFVELLAQNGFAGKLAIASTACRRDIDVFLEMTDMRRLFPKHMIISRENLTRPKPDPEAYNLGFALLGLPDKARQRVAVFEDDPRGIMSAKAAGLSVFAITTHCSRESLAGLAVPPDYIADSFAEFTSALGLRP